MDNILSLFVGTIAIVVVLALFIYYVARDFQRNPPAITAIALPPQAAAQPRLLPRPGWHAIGGDRLELLDTGWAIVLHGGTDRPYRLYSPEGSIACWCTELTRLQVHAELLAGERALFTDTGPTGNEARAVLQRAARRQQQ